MDTVIRVENVSKRYEIGKNGAGSDGLRHAIHDFFTAPFNRRRAPAADIHNQHSDEFWALKDISFDVKRGEVLGIIGRNGAGKSTLLKILSRITEPTNGRVGIRGRVASLLEVGTGFHPELTGRENVFLNGAILGMTKEEIKRKFDEIVAFAEVEKFLDTPVKRYSSGMYVRLAFSVAAHLDPEILIIDEVLAVGDASFQKKCLGRIGEVAQAGRTVLFVSHNLPTVQRLCQSALLLDEGKIRAAGTADNVATLYLQQGASNSLSWKRSTPAVKDAYFKRVYLSDETGQEVEHVTTASSVTVVMEFVLKNRCRNLQLSVALADGNRGWIFGSGPQDAGISPPEDAGDYRAVMSFPPEILMAKPYGIAASLWLPSSSGDNSSLDFVDCIQFNVDEAASLSNSLPDGRVGTVAIRCNWSVDRVIEDVVDNRSRQLSCIVE
jgi:lipopolysaccharide transport system ATP-binding protein